VDLTLDGDVEPPAPVKVGLYRITQEALNNIVKHARATQVAIALHGNQDQIRLTIKDNGRGFDPASVPQDCLGLSIMQERAQEIDARLDISSTPGHSTRVMVAWPGEGEGVSDV
jgi:signal transduction histidine kinase